MARLLLVVAPLFAAPALAGDYAERNVIGFSPDGAYFAFVEYGVQDGSGFPYANAYIIATGTDSWVKETPVHVLIEDETASLATVYSQAMEGIRPLVEQFQIATPPVVAAYNPLSEISPDPHLFAFMREIPIPYHTANSYRLALEEFQAPAASCPDMVDPFVGFRLTLTDPLGKARLLNEDKQIPASRRCPLAYRLSEVMFDQSRTVIAVLIDVLSVGFEGPDRRFLAVTAQLD